MALEDRADDLALDADAAPVDDTDLAEAMRRRLVQVLLDDRGHVARRERVEVEAVLDRERDGVGLVVGVVQEWIPAMERLPTERGRIA
jgi:hypothetical protein